MANFGFALRSTFGLLPKTEKIESVKEALLEEFSKLEAYAKSDELIEYNELNELVNSDDFKNNKNNILALDYKKTEEYRKEIQFNKLKKNKAIVNYFRVKDSSQLAEFKETDLSDDLKNYIELKEYLSSEEHKNIVTELNNNLVDEKNKEKEFKTQNKSKSIKDYYKALNSSQLKIYNDLNSSSELEEYTELQELVDGDKLLQLKNALSEQLKSEKQKVKQLKQLKSNSEVKAYLKSKDKEEIEKPNALNELEELQAYLESEEYKQKLTELEYKNTEEFGKEQKYKQLKKDSKFKTYFKFLNSPLFKHYASFKDSDELANFEQLKTYVGSQEYQDTLNGFIYKNTDEYKKEEQFESLKKSSKIVNWEKYQKSKPYILFKEIEESDLLKEYEELEEFINSDKFKEYKEYMLDKEKWQKTDDFQKETRLKELEKSADIKWYMSTKDSNKFDELKSWNITFEDDFTSGKVDETKWMNSFFWGKMNLNERYVIAGEKQYYTDNKNFEINGTTLKIVTKNEQIEGKVWHPVHGFAPQKFNYTSGMLSTAHSFRQKYGKIEAKIKLNAQYPIYQAFWLKGEKILPEIDVFKFNMDKKNRLQLSSIIGDPMDYKNAKPTTSKLNGGSFTKDYFIYTLDWEENKISWKINGIEVFKTTDNVPNEPLYLMLSSGLISEPKEQIENNAFEIDWVRCYEKVD